MADFHCMQCRYMGGADEFPAHRCGRVTCARCGVNYPTASFSTHPCIAELMSTDVAGTAHVLPSLSAGPRALPPRGARASLDPNGAA
jgi:hypothetical protein